MELAIINKVGLKLKRIVLNIKNNIISILLCLFILFLVIFSKQNLQASKDGLLLWANNVVPSLFPFFIATELLEYTNIVFFLKKFLTKIMKPVFNVSGCGAYPFIMGIISGYPVGAKIVSSFREKDICPKEECERLLSFTNNSGPLFILGAVGVGMYSSTEIGFLLLITHFLACITVGIIFRFWKKNKTTLLYLNKGSLKESRKNQISDNVDNNTSNNTSNNTYKVNFLNIGEILAKSIASAINTIILIGGFIVFFSVLLSIINQSNLINYIIGIFSPILNIFGIYNASFISCFLNGILEITNGIKMISNIPYKAISVNIILTSFLLGFGGISILLQVLAITSKTNLSIKPYIYGKLLHGIIAAFYTYIFINYFPIFNFNI